MYLKCQEIKMKLFSASLTSLSYELIYIILNVYVIYLIICLEKESRNKHELILCISKFKISVHILYCTY